MRPTRVETTVDRASAFTATEGWLTIAVCRAVLAASARRSVRFLIGPAHGASSRTPLATVGDGFVILRTTCRVRHVPVVTGLAHLGLAIGAAEWQRHLRWQMDRLVAAMGWWHVAEHRRRREPD